MSLHLPVRRAARSGTQSVPNLDKALIELKPLPSQFHAHDAPSPSTPHNDEPSSAGADEETKTPRPYLVIPDRRISQEKPKPPSRTTGDISPSSIFEDEKLAGPKTQAEIDARGKGSVRLAPRNPDYMQAALDPRPGSRKRWEAKQWIRHIRRGGNFTKAELLKRQERELLSKSHDFKTSVKKLVPLARQIAGKTIEDAILQMRFSKKKAAIDVKAHLEHAKNEAIVRRGMGLGKVGGKVFQPVEIQTKDGKRIKVDDPTEIYIDQAWVGKGLHGEEPDFRARGQIHMMINPTTSLSVILKEEKTRIRLHEEKQQKNQESKGMGTVT